MASCGWFDAGCCAFRTWCFTYVAASRIVVPGRGCLEQVAASEAEEEMWRAAQVRRERQSARRERCVRGYCQSAMLRRRLACPSDKVRSSSEAVETTNGLEKRGQFWRRREPRHAASPR
jgi:hypothetical protein